MNIYSMYNKKKNFGFFVVRDTWQTIVAEVIDIEGATPGFKLEGRPPYFGNPKVTARFYKCDDMGNVGGIVDDKNIITRSFVETAELRSPGTNAYTMVEPHEGIHETYALPKEN